MVASAGVVPNSEVRIYNRILHIDTLLYYDFPFFLRLRFPAEFITRSQFSAGLRERKKVNSCAHANAVSACLKKTVLKLISDLCASAETEYGLNFIRAVMH